jgi:hypothetical protein
MEDSEIIEQMRRHYKVAPIKREEALYKTSQIAESQRQILVTIKKFFETHLEHYPQVAETNLAYYYQLKEEFKKGLQLRQMLLWERPVSGTVIRYLDPESPLVTLRGPCRVYGADSVYIHTYKRGKVPRYCLIFEEIYSPFDQLKNRNTGLNVIKKSAKNKSKLSAPKIVAKEPDPIQKQKLRFLNRD